MSEGFKDTTVAAAVFMSPISGPLSPENSTSIFTDKASFSTVTLGLLFSLIVSSRIQPLIQLSSITQCRVFMSVVTVSVMNTWYRLDHWVSGLRYLLNYHSLGCNSVITLCVHVQWCVHNHFENSRARYYLSIKPTQRRIAPKDEESKRIISGNLVWVARTKGAWSYSPRLFIFVTQ